MDFSRLLESCRHELTAYCRHLLWKKEELEDALQEVVLQAWRAYPKFIEGDFKRWIFRVATNTVFNLNRKHRDRPAAHIEHAIEIEAQLHLEERYHALLGELDGNLRVGLEQLSDIERSIFLLRSLGEMKYQEIADTLSIPIGTVMGNLARARAKLRKALSEQVDAV